MGRSVATSAGIFGSNNPSRGHQRAGVKTFFLIKQQKHRQSTALAEPIRTRWLMAACAHFFCMICVSEKGGLLLRSAVYILLVFLEAMPSTAAASTSQVLLLDGPPRMSPRHRAPSRPLNGHQRIVSVAAGPRGTVPPRAPEALKGSPHTPATVSWDACCEGQTPSGHHQAPEAQAAE